MVGGFGGWIVSSWKGDRGGCGKVGKVKGWVVDGMGWNGWG